MWYGYVVGLKVGNTILYYKGDQLNGCCVSADIKEAMIYKRIEIARHIISGDPYKEWKIYKVEVKDIDE